MKDHYGRKINYMRISITDLCNLRCVYCMPEEGVKKHPHQKNMSFEEIIDLIKAGVSLGVDKIRLTGGEPLVRHGIVDLVKQIGDIAGIKDLTMTTNGILLTKYAKELKAAGLNRVNISLDTFDAEKFHQITRWGHIEDVLSGIEAAKAVGMKPIKINTVLIKGFNDNEIETFVNYTKDEDVFVRFIELMPLGESSGFAENQYLSNNEVLKRMPQLTPVLDANKTGPAEYYQLPGAKGRVGLINPISKHFCSECNRIRITTDGKIKPCLHSDYEIDIIAHRKKGESYQQILLQAINEKPEKHHINDHEKQVLRNMNEIGG
ncbi:GTP 3',8-cyclase MoaA [Acetobacterium woodii]|uniref:GTP 3',8-cyclase n=1 Tax=Acetobacterium woodii (strain ATCC 29683 / DSM 1030 / JCM 2381 / KCTC 1655 / WB1) TaxID=931626 RepID=H6LFA7_ACEWD|nr:GTP 3',8-cyclase MoaA [Acetobacterium woodii]AFA48207.1 molybdenum cofactor biosynthesis protein A [Acetobacterium woodii DSM 1030]